MNSAAEAAWARRSLVATDLQRSGLQTLQPIVEKLRTAIRELRSVDMSYRSSNQPVAQCRKLDPYALVHRWGWWYVAGYCHLRRALRLFRVDRISELAPTDQAFTIPADFDIHAFLAAEFQGEQMVRVRMRFNPQAATVALDNPLNWEAMEKETDGSIVVSFSAPDLTWAASTILAYGSLVTALEPVELRQMVSEWAREIQQLYS